MLLSFAPSDVPEAASLEDDPVPDCVLLDAALSEAAPVALPFVPPDEEVFVAGAPAVLVPDIAAPVPLTVPRAPFKLPVEAGGGAGAAVTGDMEVTMLGGAIFTLTLFGMIVPLTSWSARL